MRDRPRPEDVDDVERRAILERALDGAEARQLAQRKRRIAGIVRIAGPADLDALAQFRAALWPDGSLDEHRDEARALLEGHPRSTLPLVVFVAEAEGRVVGFVEVGLRSHADGCDSVRPCGFIEGWYVVPEHQRRGVGRLLMAQAEAWAIENGCVELASDTWIDNQDSQDAHAALGFEVVDRCVNYRKTIRRP
jgi:aminoglycoside 6'-N-acetyltransferase I